jgi:hypothetical protein
MPTILSSYTPLRINLILHSLSSMDQYTNPTTRYTDSKDSPSPQLHLMLWVALCFYHHHRWLVFSCMSSQILVSYGIIIDYKVQMGSIDPVYR